MILLLLFSVALAWYGYKNLGTDIKLAMEEYANTGFAKMMYKTSTIPGYIESMEEIVADILEKD